MPQAVVRQVWIADDRGAVAVGFVGAIRNNRKVVVGWCNAGFLHLDTKQMIHKSRFSRRVVAKHKHLRRTPQLPYGRGTSEHELLCKGVERVVIELPDHICELFHYLLQSLLPSRTVKPYRRWSHNADRKSVNRWRRAVLASYGTITVSGVSVTSLHPCISKNTNVLAPGFIPGNSGKNDNWEKVCSAGMKVVTRALS